MANAKITKKPTGKVSSLGAPARVKNTWGFNVTWKVPAALTDKKKNNRAEGLEFEWILGLGRGSKNPKITKKVGLGSTSATLWLNANWKIGSQKWKRESFYPWTKVVLYNVHFRIRAYNKKGKGPWLQVSRAMELPRNPSVATPSQNEESGIVSTTVKQDRGWSDYKEAGRCYYWVKKCDTFAGDKKLVTASKGDTGSTEFTLKYDVANRYKQSYSDYIQVQFIAQGRGWRGVSSKDGVIRNIYVSYPLEPVINSVTIPNKDAESKVTVNVNIKRNTQHPVTNCCLEKLVNVAYTSASQIPADASWTDTNINDNGTCTALAGSVQDFIPATPGKTTWVRAKVWNQFESFYRYSNPVRLAKLETPVPEADEVAIVAARPGVDGESAVVVLGWDADGKDDSTSTEISWSDNENAWRSTKAPSTYEFDWYDKENGSPVQLTAYKLKNGTYTDTKPADEETIAETVTFRKSATVYIEKLDEGTLYYVKARRHLESDDVDNWGEYSAASTVLPTTTPPSVSLAVPAFIARGASLPLTWTFGADVPQKNWQVLTGTLETIIDPESDEDDEGATVERQTILANATVVAEGTDSLGSTVLNAERVASLVGENGTSLPLAVMVSTGGDFITSSAMEVRIADKPELTLTIPEKVTAQAPSIGATCNTLSNIALVITAQGGSGEYPDGTKTQVAGDTIYSDVIQPVWDENLNTTFTLPEGLDFWDGCKYTVAATAIDQETQLVSDEVTGEFTVEWAHQAPVPPEELAITPLDETDEDGFRTRQCAIQLSAPEGAAETDVYDVYRVTPDGAYVIAENVGQNDSITDPYAPFGGEQKGYRVACRTADGDVNWLDYEYELAGNDLRIDFGGQYIELPWNLSIGDSYSKDFESRQHLGEPTPQGYWNENIGRKASFSTDLIEIEEQAKAKTLRDLARYDGAVFVRTPDGCAYPANVEVSGLDQAYDSAVISVALDGEEVAMLDQFRAVVPLPEEPENPDSETPGEDVPEESEG